MTFAGTDKKSFNPDRAPVKNQLSSNICGNTGVFFFYSCLVLFFLSAEFHCDQELLDLDSDVNEG